MSICSFIENYWDGVLIFRGFIVLVMVITVFAVLSRARNEDWNFGFLLNSYFTPELFNWHKYGILSILLMLCFSALIAVILFSPTILRTCLG
jgi:ABC-type phosphate/phosphonate transport system permease subunit